MYRYTKAAAALEFTGTDDEQAAALKIQAMQRGKADRARVAAIKANKEAEAAGAAAAEAAAADGEVVALPDLSAMTPEVGGLGCV